MALARQINKATIVKIARNSYSPKSSSMQYMESILESDVCLTLDFDPKVESYVTQPDSFININNEPGWKRYTPDGLIKFTDGSHAFFETKPEFKTWSDDFKKKHELHKRIVKEQTGHELILFTEKQLSPGKLIQYSQLVVYCKCESLSEVNEVVLDHLS